MPSLSHLVGEELRVSIRRPQFLVTVGALVAIVALPAYSVLASSVLDHWTQFFSEMFSWLALVYPLMVALLTQPRLLDEWSNTYALYTRARVDSSKYFASKVAAAAALTGAVFLLLTFACFIVARLAYTSHGYAVPLSAAIESRFPFSQLWLVAPWLYVVAFGIWVSAVSATVAAWCTLLTASIGNRFAALAAPLLIWLGVNVGLSLIGAEELRLPPFRFGITQQPIWTEFVGWAALVLCTVVLWWRLQRARYESPGIIRS